MEQWFYNRKSMKGEKKNNKIDMQHGPLMKSIIMFALPLIASGILQQSFNSCDVAVVGRFCDPQSLAAVGSNGMIISLVLGLVIGVSIGANVVIAHYIGRKDMKSVKNAVSTTMTMSVVLGVALIAIGVSVARPLLEAISTPEDVIEPATEYLRIYFTGMPFFLIYNFGSAILRSVGDTKRPFYCLVAGGCVNVVLNVILVVGFGMGVSGVAIATVVSNVISSALLLRILSREDDAIRVDLKNLRINRAELGKIFRIGLPAGIQSMVFPLSNVFIMSGINTFGSAGSAGSAAALNFEYYCYFIIASFASAAVAFTSQNYGSGNTERCSAIYRNCMLLSVIGCAFLNILIAWQKEFFVGVFTTDPEVVRYAFIRIEYVLLFQFIASSYEIAGACMRGLGYSMTPTLITIAGTCIVRIAWVYVFHQTDLLEGMDGLLMVYPVTWALTGTAVVLAYHNVRRMAYNKVGNVTIA